MRWNVDAKVMMQKMKDHETTQYKKIDKRVKHKSTGVEKTSVPKNQARKRRHLVYFTPVVSSRAWHLTDQMSYFYGIGDTSPAQILNSITSTKVLHVNAQIQACNNVNHNINAVQNFYIFI